MALSGRKAGLTLAAALMVLPPAGRAQPRIEDGDNATLVSELRIAAPDKAPVPRVGPGAPYLSVEQTESFICQAQLDGAYPLRAAIAANTATVKVEQLRLDVFAGRKPRRELDAAEVERQIAVRALLGGRPLSADRLPPPSVNGLAIRDAAFQFVRTDKGRAVIVTGRIENTRADSQEVGAQGLTVHLLDAQRYVVASRSTPLAKTLLKKGQSMPFTYVVEGAPQYAETAEVRFAPPFVLGNVRGCLAAALDAEEDDPLVQAPEPSAAEPLPAIGEGAPRYTLAQAQDLVCEALVTQRFAPSWALAAYESAKAVAAAQASGDRARLEQAELRRQAMVRGMLGRDGLVRAETLPAPERGGLRLEEIAQRRVEVGGGRSALRISGLVRNTLAQETQAPPIAMRLIDERGFVVDEQSAVLDNPAVAAGEARRFSVTVHDASPYAAAVRAHFAPPMAYRRRFACPAVMRDHLAESAGAVRPVPADTAARALDAAAQAAGRDWLDGLRAAEAVSSQRMRTLAWRYEAAIIARDRTIAAAKARSEAAAGEGAAAEAEAAEQRRLEAVATFEGSPPKFPATPLPRAADLSCDPLRGFCYSAGQAAEREMRQITDPAATAARALPIGEALGP